MSRNDGDGRRNPSIGSEVLIAGAMRGVARKLNLNSIKACEDSSLGMLNHQKSIMDGATWRIIMVHIVG